MANHNHLHLVDDVDSDSDLSSSPTSTTSNKDDNAYIIASNSVHYVTIDVDLPFLLPRVDL
jgi:hypothetical protein